MSDFDKLCKQLEEMDPESFTQLFNELSARVTVQLVDIAGKDGLNAYLNFILASVAADGKMTEKEFELLKPIFEGVAEKELTYQEGVEIFKSFGFDESDTFKNIVDLMVDVVGIVSDGLKDDIVMLCLLVCAIDGEVSEKEKDWIRQLVDPLTICIPSLEIIDGFLTEAKTFTLATTCGDQPRMRVLGLKIRLDGKLFFAVGTFKPVYRQLKANPKCEILASVGTDFLRWDGEAVFVDDPRLMPMVEKMMPDLVKKYNELGLTFGFFTLVGGSAEVVNAFNQKKKLF
jgi:uncharacterized pyridoxamine 5'-phosphate oxidase family protein